MRYFLLLVLFVGFGLEGISQSQQLAKQYYDRGEYEKAASLYKSLFDQSNQQYTYLEKYVDCLIEMEDYEQANQVIEEQIQSKGKDAMLYLLSGTTQLRQGAIEDAERSFENAIDQLEPNRSQIIRLSQSLYKLGETEMAIKAYEKGSKLLKDEAVFAYNIGGLYQRQGNIPKMIEYFLISLKENSGRLDNIKKLFQRYITKEEEFEILQEQVYAIIQEGDANDAFPELLAWSFIQADNYTAAFRQVTAIDRRNQENGRRVYNLGQTAENAGDFRTAVRAYKYIIEEKGESSPYYMPAQQMALNARLEQLIDGYDFEKSEIRELYQDYNQFLDEKGRSARTASIIEDQARVAALYLNDMEEAIRILEELIDIRGIPPLIQARAKLQLGDYYLINHQRWDASLLYSQVDKAFPEADVGEQARYKNAMLSYYYGDFEWAQEQLDILKAATSRFISNDAIDRSVFIMDHLNLDTTAHPLSLYSEAELFVFQNLFEEAQLKMDSILSKYPEHGLLDDVLYLKAKIAMKKRAYTEARDYYERIVEEFPEEIRADNALFAWAELEQNQLENPEKAKELYEQLFLNYTNSTFAEEARKRFRELRGDEL